MAAKKPVADQFAHGPRFGDVALHIPVAHRAVAVEANLDERGFQSHPLGDDAAGLVKIRLRPSESLSPTLAKTALFRILVRCGPAKFALLAYGRRELFNFFVTSIVIGKPLDVLTEGPTSVIGRLHHLARTVDVNRTENGRRKVRRGEVIRNTNVFPPGTIIGKPEFLI